MITPARSAETDWQRLILDCKVLLITSKSLKRLPGGWIQCLRALIANWSVFERPPHRVRRNFGAFASDGLPSNPTPLRHGSANIVCLPPPGFWDGWSLICEFWKASAKAER